MTLGLLIVLVVLACVALVSAAVMVRGSGARSSGAALAAGGVLLLVGAGLGQAGLDGRVAFVAAGQLALPVALALYPAARLRHPLSYIVLVIIVGAGVTAIVWGDAAWSLALVEGGALVVHAWWVLERGGAGERRAMTWAAVAWAGTGLAAAFLGFVFAASNVSDPVAATVELAIVTIAPVAMAVGVVRPHVLDVRGIVTSVVVTATVILTFVAVAVAITEGVRLVSGTPFGVPATIVVCAVLAFGVQPLRVLLRGVVDQLLFGDRPDPLTAATSLADRIGEDPAAALAALRDALVLPYTALIVDGETLATSGTSVTHTRTIPLQLGDGMTGSIVAGLRAGDLRLDSGDEDVLRIIAPLIALLIRSQRLAEALAHSRGAAIAGREEERRRLRRDLHDGLGPTLTGVAYAADAARNQLSSSPATAAQLLVQLRADTADAIAEVRRLVDGLRPPALDELGLVGALRSWASRLHSARGGPLLVTFDQPDPLPELDAAQEVAAYRIVIEALTNVARHSGSDSARVRLAAQGGWLSLEVTDDGVGGMWSPGTGIASMRERAEQVGGRLELVGTTGGRVAAHLPLTLGSAQPARG